MFVVFHTVAAITSSASVICFNITIFMLMCVKHNNGFTSTNCVNPIKFYYYNYESDHIALNLVRFVCPGVTLSGQCLR